MMLTRPKIFFLTLFLHAVGFCMGEKVLFIGNSYTAQCSKTISGLFKSESPDWSLSFHTSGGKDLAFHLADSQVTKKINSQKWDFIVLQEQSQKSGLGGKFSKSFHESVASLSKVIRKAGAIPCLYLTWGRKDGDKRNSGIYPTYEAMQKKISSAYLLAGEKNKARILPVGFAYSEVKKKNQSSSKIFTETMGVIRLLMVLIWYPVYSGADSPERIHAQLNLTDHFQKKMQKAFARQRR
jgi:hypothetical protein